MSPTSWNEETATTSNLSQDHQRRPNFDLSAPFRVGEMSPVAAPSSNTPNQSRRNFPICHGPAEAPICIECQALQLTFYDPNCKGCRSELVDRPNVGVPNILAILRQWVPQVQLSVEFLISEALRRGAHPDDRDSVTDMTLLMYAVKAGASGVGDPEIANRVVKNLLVLGASLDLRCRWTQMSALHYATYFDVGPIVTTLLMESKGIDVDCTCDEFENGTPLHIAAENLSVEAAKALLGFGADVEAVDDLARKPVECIPDEDSMTSLAFSTDEAFEAVARLKVLLSGGLDAYRRTFGQDEGGSAPVIGGRASVSGRTVMRALGLKIGDRVLVGGLKLGTLVFCGITDFAPGIWAGVELDEPEGKHSGTVDGVTYFLCKPEHGVFVQPNKISKVGKYYRDPTSPSSAHNLTSTQQTRPPMTKVNHGKVDISKVSSRLTDAIAEIAERSEIRVGDRVSVSGIISDKKHPTTCQGIVRFVGNVDFVEDDNKWYGVELDEPLGRHDGTVGGIRYFAANVDRGIFVTESKLTKISKGIQVITRLPLPDEPPPPEGTNFSMNFHALSVSSNNVSTSENKPQQTPLRRTLSMQHREQTKVNSETPEATVAPAPESTKDCSIPVGATSPVPSLTRSTRSTTHFNSQSSSSPEWKSVGTIQTNKFAMKRSPCKKYLEPGESVICIHNKEMGVVKYVGRTDFGPGIWLGIELRNPKGKHDGMVEGRRYFSCRPNHGIMIRPSRVSVHGINGDQLLKAESDYPF